MKYVGGYQAYRLLLEDARAFDDVLLALQGEAEAERIKRMTSGR